MTAGAKKPTLKKRLEVVPPDLVEAMRAATIDQDPERLFDLIDGVAGHDREVAEYLRGLLNDIAYESLEEFFDVQGR